jgi:FtsP/CotA-like multicopper oxidase with cupredoxin domain
MRSAKIFLLPVALVVFAGIAPQQASPPAAAANDNRNPAGTLREGVLTIALDATLATWHPDGDSLPGLEIETFAEEGGRPLAPGPLIRVPKGTTIRARIRNRLAHDTLTFVFPAKMGGADRTGNDTLTIAPGNAGELVVRATRPGNYAYRAYGRTALDRSFRIRGLLGGAVVVDSGPPTADRVLVLLTTSDRMTATGTPDRTREVRGINGRSWPHTERISTWVGDTLRWRIINLSPSVHPMHLHGVYYTVENFDGPNVTAAQAESGRLVVTERMTPFTTMTMSWSPERPGNWLFHCHFQDHAMPHRPLGDARARTASHTHATNHAATGMGGLVMGVEARSGGARNVSDEAKARRMVRLAAVKDAGLPDSLLSLRFVPEENGSALGQARQGTSPPLELIRDQPVTIRVVNRLGEPISVHWHGIELESYFDGVAGFSGIGAKLSPLIAAGDSFDVQMTPPRSGTFLYHSHVEEPRHHRAGLVGALIVRDAPLTDIDAEHVFVLKSSRGSGDDDAREINGQSIPDTVVLRTGKKYRFRIANMSVGTPNATVNLTSRPSEAFPASRDTMLVRWRPVAKDGADLPSAKRTSVLATQIVSIGETFDFEVEPAAAGALWLEVIAPARRSVTVRVPIRVELDQSG